MSGLDRVLYNTRQQLLSSDLNLMQALSARDTLDALRWALATCQEVDDNDNFRYEQLMSVVLGGLEVDGDPIGVRVLAGTILQPYPGVGTAPSATDSPYVFGRLANATSLAVPVLGADTWYLIQGRVNEATTTVARNIWDPGSSAFIATPVGVRTEQTIELVAKVGTPTAFPTVDAGFVPIAAVKRLASAAIPTSKEIIDLRPLARDAAQRVSDDDALLQHAQVRPQSLDNSVASTSWAFRFTAELNEAGKLFARTDSDATFIDLASAPYLDPSNLLADGWHYIYLAQWGARNPSSVKPRNAYDEVRAGGILVLSHVPPDRQGYRACSSALLGLPEPFGAYAQRSAICVGMLFRSGGFWLPSFQVGTKFWFPNNVLGSTTALPVNARSMHLRARSSTANDAILVKVGASVIASSPTAVANGWVDLEVPLMGLSAAQIASITYTTTAVTYTSGIIFGFEI